MALNVTTHGPFKDNNVFVILLNLRICGSLLVALMVDWLIFIFGTLLIEIANRYFVMGTIIVEDKFNILGDILKGITLKQRKGDK